MEFCPKCKSLMKKAGEVLKCRNASCGFEKAPSAKAEPEPVAMPTRKREDRGILIVEEPTAGLPTTKSQCPECGNGEAYWWLRQMRGADEPETRFYRCTKCSKTWRERQ
jgi:DNA-directed RNA polymerase subunit M